MTQPQIQQLKLTEIKPDPNNPRGESDVAELATSIKTHGVLQPILVRKSGKGYTIIAGERRFKAATMIAQANGGVKKAMIPAIVKDVDDDTAFEIQTIENLQREDLPPYNEALAFKTYMAKFGEDSAETLAEKIGCKPSYIRSRAAVFDLPAKVLKSWSKGNIIFGHLNAMLMVKEDANLVERLLEDAEYGNSVKSLMEKVQRNSCAIATAVFDTNECGACSHNSDKQKSLFGFGHDKAHCAKPECFITKTQAHLDTEFADPKGKLRKKCGTNGYLLALSYDDTKNIKDFQSWEKKGPFAECKTCDKFITVFTLKDGPQKGKSCKNPECHKKLSKAGDAAARKQAHKDVKANEEKPRCAWHGKLFREKFYMERIPARAAEIKPDSVEALHTAILALTLAHELRDELASLIGSKRSEMVTGIDIMDRLANVDFESSLQVLRDLSIHTVMDWNDHKSGFGTTTRDAVAKAFGIDIAAEWKPSEEYLLAKSKKEIIAWIGTLPKDDVKAIKDFAMRRGAVGLDALKKPALVSAILESGVDLTGRTPDEIVNYDNTAFVPSNKRHEKASEPNGTEGQDHESYTDEQDHEDEE
jgi:ParB/RepB/Spo0J family partition protein